MSSQTTCTSAPLPVALMTHQLLCILLLFCHLTHCSPVPANSTPMSYVIAGVAFEFECRAVFSSVMTHFPALSAVTIYVCLSCLLTILFEVLAVLVCDFVHRFHRLSLHATSSDCLTVSMVTANVRSFISCNFQETFLSPLSPRQSCCGYSLPDSRRKHNVWGVHS